MKRKGEKPNTAKLLTVIVFACAIGALFLLMLFLPKKTGELSPLEFRVLADYPWRPDGTALDSGKLAKNIFKGKFSEDVDSFLEDHFPARGFFIALDSYYLRLTGRNADQSVVKGKNGRLFDSASKPDMERLSENVDKIESFAAANGLETVYLIVPTSAAVVKDELPALSLEYHDDEIIASIRERGLCAPDLIALLSGDDAGSLLYRTDHHWTMEGAYRCYEAACAELELTPVSRDAFTVESYDFYGSYYRKAGLWSIKPDTLEIWRAPELDSASVTLGFGPGAVTHTGVYDAEKLQKGEVDRYAAYLYSNNGLTIVEMPEGNGETLMILKDSFGNSIAPLFAMNYSRIIMVDTRYYKALLPFPSELVSEYGVTKLLVVLGTDSAASDIQTTYLN